MARLAQQFDPTQHDTEQRAEFENLPDGIYELELESSKGNEKNSDTYFRLDTVINVRAPEEYAGRKLFNGFNLVHSNTQAMEIANREFATLCRAIGHEGAVDDSEDLHLRPFVAKIGMGKPSKEKNADGTPKYPARSEIKRYFFPDEGPLPEIGVTAPPVANDNKPAPAKPAAAAAPKPAGSRPWGSKK